MRWPDTQRGGPPRQGPPRYASTVPPHLRPERLDERVARLDERVARLRRLLERAP
ncbi:MAG TPA: hypothetical protein VIL46_01065 [Gemmataceae bacterium]